MLNFVKEQRCLPYTSKILQKIEQNLFQRNVNSLLEILSQNVSYEYILGIAVLVSHSSPYLLLFDRLVTT